MDGLTLGGNAFSKAWTISGFELLLGRGLGGGKRTDVSAKTMSPGGRINLQGDGAMPVKRRMTDGPMPVDLLFQPNASLE
jgi:hypothetical protein